MTPRTGGGYRFGLAFFLVFFRSGSSWYRRPELPLRDLDSGMSRMLPGHQAQRRDGGRLDGRTGERQRMVIAPDPQARLVVPVGGCRVARDAGGQDADRTVEGTEGVHGSPRRDYPHRGTVAAGGTTPHD